MARLPDSYTIWIKCRLGATGLSAFLSIVSDLKGGETVLTGLLEDRSAVFGVLAGERRHGLVVYDAAARGRPMMLAGWVA